MPEAAAPQKSSSWPARASRDNRRVFTLFVASIGCATASIILGFGSWHLAGAAARGVERDILAPLTSVVDQQMSTLKPTTPTVEATVLPAGSSSDARALEVAVEAGVVELVREQRPVRKVIVEPFLIGETEVTNAQYLEFIRATDHRAPANWASADVPNGAAEEPVTYVTWHDAVDYCRWLSGKINAEVRLPTEAEWLHAAAGPLNFKYPWGDAWDARAAVLAFKNAGPHVVKRFPLNKSTCGAYDMAGNVWEWVADDVEMAKETGTAQTSLKVIKGGAVDESIDMIGVAARSEAPADSADRLLGFRYVIVPGKTSKDTHEERAR